MEYQVKTDVFEGPLDLLLHLINRLEIDIYDIPMAEITEQYVFYVQAMTELELDHASEYLVMAATLLAIKSKMLLPSSPDQMDGDDIFLEEEDPREELVEQLIEYKKYKDAAEQLMERGKERSLMHTKPPLDLSDYMKESSAASLPIEFSIYDMIGAYHRLLRRKKLQKPLATKITSREISIDDRMDEVIAQLRLSSKPVNFFSFFPFDDKQHMVITFLAMLELMKRDRVIVEQENLFSDIYICLRKDENIIARN